MITGVVPPYWPSNVTVAPFGTEVKATDPFCRIRAGVVVVAGVVVALPAPPVWRSAWTRTVFEDSTVALVV